MGTNVVFVGPCDPASFQPKNLTEQGLITEADAAQLRYDILSADITVLRLPWIQIVAETTKLVASTTLETPLGEPMRDFVLAYCDALTNKSFTALGINHSLHFGIADEQGWHKIGNTLVPKDHVWSATMTAPGMASVAVQGKRLDSDLLGALTVRVEPSVRVKPGVYVNMNDHFDAPVPNEDPDFLIGVLEDQWDSSKARLDRIVADLKGLADVVN
ncbi:MAG TPA: hypothetical protein VGV41_22115 [Pseudolabrys sp.]|uniref:hypothetical protein n=1 Tax=Pseudolabrys sp. TaxID=1960880 RepID=UPI002DDD6B28|nr:hypothetical protein [Pseudolabrys sp.]HEV2631328.1 hypothetical protein [Pseudolabrys sp.]